MQYISTRGDEAPRNFRDVTLAGLAPDGGLFLPVEWPRFSESEIADLAGLPYAKLAARVMAPFVAGALDGDRLGELCEAAYAGFAHDAVTPLVQLDQQHWLLELFHGPTLAFKDVALQLLGHLFEEFLAGESRGLTIVGATSGDTGSAAIHAVAGRDNIEIFMLHPKGRVSDVQRRQMTSIDAPNVHNIAIDGSFDDAQAHVKRMFSDRAINGRFRIGAVNSINWARLMAQVVYYFAAALQLGAPFRKVAFAVPTGNFGDVFAGYVAQRMGLPVERLIVATNVNDILHRALSDGDYSARGLTPTDAPSMDIEISSNFERLLFDAGGRDGAALAAQMRGFDADRAMRLTNAQAGPMRELFSSARADADATAAAMRWAFDHCGEIIDPHTAVGLHAALAAGIAADVPVVTLATAHPAKFAPAVERATGQKPELPARLGDLMGLPEHYSSLPGTYEAVADFVTENAREGGAA